MGDGDGPGEERAFCGSRSAGGIYAPEGSGVEISPATSRKIDDDRPEKD